MCGIAGIVRASGPRPDDRALVQAMIDRLRHRGPDGEGVVVSGPATLGHRRLAVIDLSERAAQPMRSPARACWLSYNGEVYGADALRDELASERPFVSRSDSEVVLAAYERWGEGCLERLNGMFAFAVWDEERGRLFLARDRYGQKPLYTARTPDGGLAFASELGALRVLDELDLSLDRAAVAKYLALDCFPSPTTIHRGVRALPPGCFLVWEEGRARVSRYHRRRYGGCALGPEAAAEELWRLLRASVRRRLVSDVPLGIFLSGGVDSSAVLAAAAAEAPAERLRTFSIGFREASFDESAVARRVAAHFGVRHAERVLEPGALLDLVPAALAALDQPLADASLVPTYALCRFAREHVTCALGGDGGDELFAGYDTFLAERLVALWLASPAALRRAASALARRLPPSDRRMSLQLRARRFVDGAGPDPVERNLRWFGSFLPEEASAIVLGAPPPERLHEDLRGEPFPRGQEALDLWTRWYLPDDVLTKVDRASMAVSLEARAPLLDRELAAFAHALPFAYKLRGLRRKWIFKRALRGRLPAWLLRRRKQGFGAPNGEWLRGPLRGEVEELFAPERLVRGGLLDPAPVRRLVEEHLSGRRDHRKRLWALYVLQRWLATMGLS